MFSSRGVSRGASRGVSSRLGASRGVLERLGASRSVIRATQPLHRLSRGVDPPCKGESPPGPPKLAFWWFSGLLWRPFGLSWAHLGSPFGLRAPSFGPRNFRLCFYITFLMFFDTSWIILTSNSIKNHLQISRNRPESFSENHLELKTGF